MQKDMITGNQAIARGFYEAGGQVAASYPGSPTVEIIDALKGYPSIYSEFSTNEKVALEVAMGASMGGVRAMASMKHVGVNIAMDPLMTFTQTVINGGFLLISGDDPGMMSSQNEQDNRLLAAFANMPVLDPGDAQEAKDYTKLAFDISEEFCRPVMLRITSRLCHGRSVVHMEEPIAARYVPFVEDQAKYCMLPPYTFEAQHRMKDKMKELANASYFRDLARLEDKGTDTLIITSGLMYSNLLEVSRDFSVLKLGMVHPLDIEWIRQITESYERVLVLEEMMPFIEEALQLAGIACEGKKYFSFTGELDVADIREGLVAAGLLQKDSTLPQAYETTPRGPLFCAGCPHRPVFDILKKAKVRVIGDIGCYSMGLMPPFEVLKTNISMGASLGMVKGMRKAMDMHGEKDVPLVSVIGDGTFFHSGLPGFANLLYQLEGEENITILVLDNGTTAMTGGQATAASGDRDQIGQHIDIEALIKTMGFSDVQKLDQFHYKKAKETMQAAFQRPGVSVIITTRPCALRYKIRNPHFYVDPEICIACRSCIRTNCPPLRMKDYEGFDKKKSSIDPVQCVGCSICAQVCPVQAIKSSAVKKEA